MFFLVIIFDRALTFFRKGLMFFDKGMKLNEVGLYNIDLALTFFVEGL